MMYLSHRFKNREFTPFGNFKLYSSVFISTTIIFYLISTIISMSNSYAASNKSYISTEKGKDAFTLFTAGKLAPLVASSQDYPGVQRVLKHLQADINRVTDVSPTISMDALPEVKEVVLIGTLGKHPLLEKLIKSKKLDVAEIVGKREMFLIQVIAKPFPNVDRALIIVGSDKRATIYGMYDLAEQIGVSPWYWWADVPVKKQTNLFVLPGRYSCGEPKVKYRGIFINDEQPALGGWVAEKFGGFNSKFYEHVFELILRLKGNFLWPAMWGQAFYVDDPISPKLADEYGVVIGTSHHEPMMRAHAEWDRFGTGSWNYEKNEKVLQGFWRYGIKRMGSNESIVTLAMRGDGDEPMTEEANIALLQKIVKDQREILGEVTGKEITTIPQVWALYKEVQEYYDRGMRTPADVTLLLCDDNWGNIRKLPKLTDEPHPGGYGIYYHFDYVGGPRNYKWLNTTQISRTWEQMHLAYEYGAREIWIVNVGDIKPMEFPISYFLDYAWNPDEWPVERLSEYTKVWTAKLFGPEHSEAIAEIMKQYTRFNSRRKPELLSPTTYSLVNYREAERIVAEYNQLLEKAQHINSALPTEYWDAFYQLALHPVEACATVNELYVTVGKNHLYARQGRALTNSIADKARKLFKKDAEITHYYNKILANGKWNHFMDQTHIGYTYWQQPIENVMPEVKTIEVPVTADMGVAIEGSESWWPDEKSEAILPAFDSFHQQQYYIEVFNRGTMPFEYSVQTGEPWIRVEPSNGKIDTEERLWVSVDWEKVPSGMQRVPLTIAGPGGIQVVVQAEVNNPSEPKRDEENLFIESNGYVSIEAEHYLNAVNTKSITWQRIPELGRTLSAMAPFPVTAPTQSPGGNAPRLEYQMYLFTSGEVKVKAILCPTLNFHNNQGLRYGISFDNEPVQIINMHANKTFQDWEESVRTNTSVEISKHLIAKPGKHVLKFWMVDPGVVLQKLVIETGEVKPGYLGPPESYYRKKM